MQRGFTIWFTGLPCSGKSTISVMLKDVLNKRGYNHLEILDGDEVRTNLSKGLTFSKEDRDINIRRIGYVCKLLSRNGAIAISAAIAPYTSVRREVREMISSEAGFVEVFVDTPAEECERRDVKGMWAKARKGEIKGFTGLDDPYEAPTNPEVICYTKDETVEQSTAKIIKYLEDNNYIEPASDGEPLSAEEEEKIKDRLKSLGYI
jgi:adenylylsulfate kinase